MHRVLCRAQVKDMNSFKVLAVPTDGFNLPLRPEKVKTDGDRSLAIGAFLDALARAKSGDEWAMAAPLSDTVLQEHREEVSSRQNSKRRKIEGGFKPTNNLNQSKGSSEGSTPAGVTKAQPPQHCECHTPCPKRSTALQHAPCAYGLQYVLVGLPFGTLFVQGAPSLRCVYPHSFFCRRHCPEAALFSR